MAVVYIEVNPNYSRTVWDSTGATNYVVGDRVSHNDGINNLIFVCLADNNSTTTPNNDSTNWVAAGSKDFPFQTKGILAFAGSTPNGFPAAGASQGELSLNEYDNNRQDESTYPNQPTNFAYQAAGPGGTIIFGDGDYATPTGSSGNGFGASNITLKSLNHQKATLLTPYSFIVSGGKGPQQSNGPLVINGFIQYRTYHSSGATGSDATNTVTFRDCYITDQHPQSTYQNDATSNTSNGGAIANVLTEFNFFYNCSIIHKRYYVNYLCYSGTGNAENCTFYIQVAHGNTGYSLFNFHNTTKPLNLKKCIIYVKHFYKSLSTNAFFGNTPAESLDKVCWFVENNYAGQDIQQGGSYGHDSVRNVDPLFINDDNNNLSLRPSSPLIGGIDSEENKLSKLYPDGVWVDHNYSLIFNTYNYVITGDGSSYTFSGDVTGTDPTLNVLVKETLTFNNTGGHPLAIYNSQNELVASESNGTTTFTPKYADTYYYQCTVAGHENMRGDIVVTKGTLGSYSNPFNGYYDAIDSGYYDQTLTLLFKEGDHAMYHQNPSNGGANNTSISSSFPGGLYFVGENSRTTRLVTAGNINGFPVFYVGSSQDRTNQYQTPLEVCNLGIHHNGGSSDILTRGLFSATQWKNSSFKQCRITQDLTCSTRSAPLDYFYNERPDGFFLKMEGCEMIYAASQSAHLLSGRFDTFLTSCTFIQPSLSVYTYYGSDPCDNIFNSTFNSSSSIKDCIFYTDAGAELLPSISTLENVFSNCCFYSTSNSFSSYKLYGSSNNKNLNNTMEDPGFINLNQAGDEDIRLRPNSALIGGIEVPFPGAIWVTNTAGTGGTGTYNDPFNFGSLTDAITTVGTNGDIVFKNGTYSNTSLGDFVFNDVSSTINQVNFYAETPGGVEFITTNQIKFGDSTFSPSTAATYNDLIFTSTSTGSDIITFDQLSTDINIKHSFVGCKFKAKIFMENNGTVTSARVKFTGCTFSYTGTTYGFEQRNGPTNNPITVFKNCLIHNYEASSAGTNPVPLRRLGDLTLDSTIIVDYFNLSTVAYIGENSVNIINCNFTLGNGTKLGNDAGNFGLNPKFTDPSKGNFSLRPNSPLIGRG